MHHHVLNEQVVEPSVLALAQHSHPAPLFRWSSCRSARMVVPMGGPVIDHTAALLLRLSNLGRQASAGPLKCRSSRPRLQRTSCLQLHGSTAHASPASRPWLLQTRLCYCLSMLQEPAA